MSISSGRSISCALIDSVLEFCAVLAPLWHTGRLLFTYRFCFGFLYFFFCFFLSFHLSILYWIPVLFCRYQINAAIHLGGPWLRRAESALKFYMQSPGSLGTANGTLSGEGDNQAATYQLLALHRYWVATRDDAFVSKVWPTCSGALAHMISSFDPNATGVLGAPNHLNAFLYLLRFQRYSELTDH